MLRTTLLTLALLGCAAVAQNSISSVSSGNFEIRDALNTNLIFSVDSFGNVESLGDTVFHGDVDGPEVLPSQCGWVESSLLGAPANHYYPAGTECSYTCQPGIYNSLHGNFCTYLQGVCDGQGHCCADGACDHENEKTLVLTHGEAVSGYSRPGVKDIWLMFNNYGSTAHGIYCTLLSYNTPVRMIIYRDSATSGYEYVTSGGASSVSSSIISYGANDGYMRIEVQHINTSNGYVISLDRYYSYYTLTCEETYILN